MASTNKTTNYELSQYVGTDKPTYLSDYNGDMFKIDAQMKTNADNIATAVSSASTAISTANSALSTAQSAETTANSASSTASSASTTAGNAQSTANSALGTATSAQTTANSVQTGLNALVEKLNLTSFETISSSSASITGSGSIINFSMYTASNSDGSIGKVYGQLKVTCNNSSGVVSFPTQLRPKDSNGDPTDITIVGVCTNYRHDNFIIKDAGIRSITIKSTGVIEVGYEWGYSGSETEIMIFDACLLFLTPFDDTPITPTV